MSARWYSVAVPFLAGVALLISLPLSVTGLLLIFVFVVVATLVGVSALFWCVAVVVDASSRITGTGLSSLYLLIGVNK